MSTNVFVPSSSSGALDGTSLTVSGQSFLFGNVFVGGSLEVAGPLSLFSDTFISSNGSTITLPNTSGTLVVGTGASGIQVVQSSNSSLLSSSTSDGTVTLTPTETPTFNSLAVSGGNTSLVTATLSGSLTLQNNQILNSSSDIVDLPASAGTLALTTQIPSIQSVNIVSFGADPTGGTDSTSAIQSAIDSAISTGPPSVYCPAGTYLVNGSLTVSSVIEFYGTNAVDTVFTANSNFIAVSLTNTNSGTVRLHDFQITNAGTTGGTTGISLSANSANNTSLQGAQVYRIIIRSGTAQITTGIAMNACTNSIIRDCIIQLANTGAGVSVQNTLNVDDGDNWITENTISNCEWGIHQFSSGGMFIHNNKIIANTYAYYMDGTEGPTPNTGTEYLQIIGNNIDVGIIYISADATNPIDGFGQVMISSNIINMTTASGAAAIEVQPNSFSGAFISQMNVTDNIILSNGSASQIGILLRATNLYSIKGNTFLVHGTGSFQAYDILATCTNGSIEPSSIVTVSGTIIADSILDTTASILVTRTTSGNVRVNGSLINSSGDAIALPATAGTLALAPTSGTVVTTTTINNSSLAAALSTLSVSSGTTMESTLTMNDNGSGTGAIEIIGGITGPEQFLADTLTGDTVVINLTNTNMRFGFQGPSGAQNSSLSVTYPYGVSIGSSSGATSLASQGAFAINLPSESGTLALTSAITSPSFYVGSGTGNGTVSLTQATAGGSISSSGSTITISSTGFYLVEITGQGIASSPPCGVVWSTDSGSSTDIGPPTASIQILSASTQTTVSVHAIQVTAAPATFSVTNGFDSSESTFVFIRSIP